MSPLDDHGRFGWPNEQHTTASLAPPRGWDNDQQSTNFRSALAELDAVDLDGPLDEALVSIAVGAAAAVPGADGAGIAIHDEAGKWRLAASGQFVGAVDEIQYRLGQGPCLLAAATGRTIISGSLGRDISWPLFGTRVYQLGVHSAVSVPVKDSDDNVIGTLNIYAHNRNMFSPRAARLGEVFAAATAATLAAVSRPRPRGDSAVSDQD